MKIHQGFVSNSSSSSFVISVEDISYAQYLQICETNSQVDTPWIVMINKTDNLIEFSTDMDNFDMYGFLVSIGVDKSQIRWD